ncbi:MAG: amidophosphoribosyltransferase, partial [Candidatus Diapherotrites archaeon]|nr:amidophosphoribosyltransferase [Candidatus Diapherotrites archaeon]
MCGVIGVIGSDTAAYEARNGLSLLQHRGQDSCGLMTIDGTEVHTHKKVGLAADRLNENVLERMKGRMAIGHVRYPTVGGDGINDAQPFFISYPFGIGIAHNGNLANFKELKKELLEKDHRHIFSNCDVEVILNVLASEIVNEQAEVTNLNDIDLLASGRILKRTMARLNGGYACVAAIAGKGMLAF